MLDKTLEPYLNYLCRKSEEKFTGKTKFELNWFKGGITNMIDAKKPLPGVIEEESKRLTR